jgi:hypothetical protein
MPIAAHSAAAKKNGLNPAESIAGALSERYRGTATIIQPCARRCRDAHLIG